MPTELQHWCLQQIGSTWHIKLVSSQIHSSVLEDTHEEKTQSSAAQVRGKAFSCVTEERSHIQQMDLATFPFCFWGWAAIRRYPESTVISQWPSVHEKYAVGLRPGMGNFMGRVAQPFSKKTALQVIKLGLWIRDRWKQHPNVSMQTKLYFYTSKRINLLNTKLISESISTRNSKYRHKGMEKNLTTGCRGICWWSFHFWGILFLQAEKELVFLM